MFPGNSPNVFGKTESVSYSVMNIGAVQKCATLLDLNNIAFVFKNTSSLRYSGERALHQSARVVKYNTCWQQSANFVKFWCNLRWAAGSAAGAAACAPPARLFMKFLIDELQL